MNQSQAGMAGNGTGTGGTNTGDVGRNCVEIFCVHVEIDKVSTGV